MNHHQRHLPPGVNRALRSLSLLLFALIFPCEIAAMPRLFFKPKAKAVKTNASGYLSSVGAPALRFQEPATVIPEQRSPALSALPAAATSSPNNLPAAASTPPAPAVLPVAGDQKQIVETKLEADPPKNKTNPHIIPDDTRAPVRPEDFLPFFQFPGRGAQTGGGLNVIVPVPREPSSSTPLPPSSANYTQTPK
jgi:hypothetical protein